MSRAGRHSAKGVGHASPDAITEMQSGGSGYLHLHSEGLAPELETEQREAARLRSVEDDAGIGSQRSRIDGDARTGFRLHSDAPSEEESGYEHSQSDGDDGRIRNLCHAAQPVSMVPTALKPARTNTLSEGVFPLVIQARMRS